MNEPSIDFPLDTREEPRPRFDALDSLRGVAALAVALYHFQVGSHIYFLQISRNAYLFVEFFFVLSGFVIAHAYNGRLNRGTAAIAFMVKRFGRVWPLHVVMLCCFIFAETVLYMGSHYVHLPLPRQSFSEDRTLIGIPINFIMLNGIVPYLGASWNAPSWSVSVELTAYLLFALTSMMPRRNLRLNLNFVLMIVALAAICVNKHVGGLERCVFSFFLGTFVWELRLALAGLTGTAAEFAALLCGVAIVLPDAPRVQHAISPLIFAMVIFIFARQSGKISRMLENSFPLRLGQISYSIYMVHFFVAFALTNIIKVGGRLAHKAWVMPGTDLALVGNSSTLMDVITLAYLAVVIVIAQFTYTYVERPGIRLFSTLGKKLRLHGADAVGAARGGRRPD